MKRRINKIKNKILVQGGTDNELKDYEIRLNPDMSLSERVNGEVVSAGEQGGANLAVQYGLTNADIIITEYTDKNGMSAPPSMSSFLNEEIRKVEYKLTNTIEKIRVAQPGDTIATPGSENPPITIMLNYNWGEGDSFIAKVEEGEEYTLTATAKKSNNEQCGTFTFVYKNIGQGAFVVEQYYEAFDPEDITSPNDLYQVESYDNMIKFPINDGTGSYLSIRFQHNQWHKILWT